ncbi:MAG TPA: hypothetical protein VJ718_05410, partial [Candidatus Binataceae bacterium]|nr:hypothetical protein [Candidatus Binataceae bacterium]
MTDQVQNQSNAANEEPLVMDRLKPAAVVAEIFYGIGIALGLGMLWAMESLRDVSFRLLDRMNIKARTHRASAFPPGPSRKNTTIQAR